MDKLIETYSPYIYKLCIKLCKSKFENWIYSICLNCYRDSYTKEKKLFSRMKNVFLITEEKENEISNYPDKNVSIEEDFIKGSKKQKNHGMC